MRIVGERNEAVLEVEGSCRVIDRNDLDRMDPELALHPADAMKCIDQEMRAESLSPHAPVYGEATQERDGHRVSGQTLSLILRQLLELH
jgi:hypothetical protein